MDKKDWHLRLSSDMHMCVHTQADVPQHKIPLTNIPVLTKPMSTNSLEWSTNIRRVKANIHKEEKKNAKLAWLGFVST